MAGIYEEIGRSIRKTNEVDADIGTLGGETILPGGFSEKINIHINGVKGVKKIPDFDSSFILGHPASSILSTNLFGLGSDTVKKLFYIYNGENSYYETFVDDSFINTGSTTATINIGSNIIFSDNDEYWTTPIFFSETNYCIAAKITIKTQDFNLDETKVYIRNSPTNNWIQYVLDGSNTLYYFNQAGNQLEIKFVTQNPINTNHITLDEENVLFTVDYETENFGQVFYEYGETNLFYDPVESTNMILDTNILNPSFRFDLPSSTYVSNLIPLKNSYGNVELTLGTYTNGSVDAYISNDSKSTWTSIPENTVISLDFNTTDNAYIKFINNSSNSITENTFTEVTPYFEVIFQPATGTGSDVTLYQNNDGEIYKLTFTK